MLQMLEGAPTQAPILGPKARAVRGKQKKCKKEYVERFEPSTMSTLKLKQIIIANELLI